LIEEDNRSGFLFFFFPRWQTQCAQALDSALMLYEAATGSCGSEVANHRLTLLREASTW